jgi:hypothetical protein
MQQRSKGGGKPSRKPNYDLLANTTGSIKIPKPPKTNKVKFYGCGCGDEHRDFHGECLKHESELKEI